MNELIYLCPTYVHQKLILKTELNWLILSLTSAVSVTIYATSLQFKACPLVNMHFLLMFPSLFKRPNFF